MCRSEAPRSTRMTSRSCIVAAMDYPPSPRVVVNRPSLVQQSRTARLRALLSSCHFWQYEFAIAELRPGTHTAERIARGVLTKNGRFLLTCTSAGFQVGLGAGTRTAGAFPQAGSRS